MGQHLDTLDPSDPVALAVAVAVLKLLPVPAVPAGRPELAETLAYRHLEEGQFQRAAMREAGPIEEVVRAGGGWRRSVRPALDPPAHELAVVSDTGDPEAALDEFDDNTAGTS